MLREMNSKLVKNIAWNVSLYNLKIDQKVSTEIENNLGQTTSITKALAHGYVRISFVRKRQNVSLFCRLMKY